MLDGVLTDLAVENFRTYLKIPSAQPKAPLGGCVRFLETQARTMNLEFEVFEPILEKPIVLITWRGTDPKLPSILLNGHMDVSAVFEEKWTCDPFGAHIDERGNIFARGAQDMKSVSIQYLEAIRQMKIKNVKLKRTIHVSFMPDEELGGQDGMNLFVKSELFKSLNVGFALDEGTPVAENYFPIVYGEKATWKMRFICPGKTGHGSMLLKNTAGVKVSKLMSFVNDFRAVQETILDNDPSATIGDVFGINITMMSGGVQSNVIPDEFQFVVDCRVPINADVEAFEQMVDNWCSEAGDGVRVVYDLKDPVVPATKLDSSNKYWMAFLKVGEGLRMDIRPEMLGGATDSRFLRQLGIPAIGFSPLNRTKKLIHDHDEYVNVQTFLKGISIYIKLIATLGNLDE